MGKERRGDAASAMSADCATDMSASDSDFGASSDNNSTTQSGSPRKTLAGNTLGVTLDGQRVFVVPPLLDPLDCLFYRWYSLPSLVAWVGILCSLFLVVRHPDRPLFILAAAVFWRLCCNLGIGAILNLESKENALMLWMDSVRERGVASRLNAVVGRVLSSVVRDRRDLLNDRSLPASLPARVAFR